jgi:hypothetical protein
MYFVMFSLKIRLLSPEFFPTVRRKDLCEGLLTDRCTMNLACEREHMFLDIFTSAEVFQCLSHCAMNLLFVKFVLYKYHGSQEKTL